LIAQKLRCSGVNLHPIDDSPKGCDMTAIEFRKKKAREMQELFEKLSTLDDTSFSLENKDRLFRTYQAQIKRLNEILDSSALQRLCSITEESAGRREIKARALRDD
jgi:hypothetical protein